MACSFGVRDFYIHTHLDPYRYSFFIKNSLWSILNSQFQPTISNPSGSYPVSSLCIGVGTRKKRSKFPKMNKIWRDLNNLKYSVTVPTQAQMPHAMALLSCSTVFCVARGPQQRTNMKVEAKQSPSSVGFGSRRNEPLWRCVEGCGACCKLDKGPSFVTPEEIFSDPTDIQVGFSFLLF